MREIADVLPGPTFSSKEKHCRAKLEEAVMQLPAHQRALLERAAVLKFRISSTSGNAAIVPASVVSPANATSEDEFFETVSEECRRGCISNFIDATGNKATAMGTCAVCAGSFPLQEIREVKVSDLRLEKKLTPTIRHRVTEHSYSYLTELPPGRKNGQLFIVRVWNTTRWVKSQSIESKINMAPNTMIAQAASAAEYLTGPLDLTTSPLTSPFTLIVCL